LSSRFAAREAGRKTGTYFVPAVKQIPDKPLRGFPG
jgi:hypothetical protein